MKWSKKGYFMVFLAIFEVFKMTYPQYHSIFLFNLFTQKSKAGTIRKGR